MGWEVVQQVIGAVGNSSGFGALVLSYSQWQAQRGHDFINRLVARTGRSEDDIADQLKHDDTKLFAFQQAFELAMTAPWEFQREILARVVSDTLSGRVSELDHISLFTRTAAHINPNDVTVLTRLADPRPDRYPDTVFAGAADELDLAEGLPPGTALLLPPVLGNLSGQ